MARKKEYEVSVVVPTYKEAKNIPVLTKEIAKAFSSVKIPYEIIIVDDNSMDGTDKAVAVLEKNYPIRLIVRKKDKGLSPAVVEGIRKSTKDIIVVMDADLSHPPAKLPEIVRQITENGADFVIGSRFVMGGSAEHFNLFRRLNAGVSKLLAMPFVRVKDPMAGFFAFPRKIVTDFKVLNPLGFKIGLEIMVKCSPKKIIEIPIQFQERLYGESKLSFKEQVNYILHLVRLAHFKYPRLSEIFRFGAVGFAGMIIDLSCVRVAYGVFHIPFRLSRVIGFITALTSNFILNRKYNFKKARKRNAYLQYAEFFAVCIIGFLLNWTVSVGLFERIEFFHHHYIVASFIGVVCGFLVNFIGSKLIVFRK